MKRLGIGLVGSGFMGRSHAHAFRAAPGVFDLPLTPVFELLADVNADAAKKAAAALGFARSTGDWRELVSDPAVDLVDITAPNTMHLPIALAAAEMGLDRMIVPEANAAEAALVEGIAVFPVRTLRGGRASHRHSRRLFLQG